MRRWSVRILVSLVLLIAVVVVVTQLVLWSSLPKKIVMSLIEKELGLRISADTLSTNWLGNSTLQNVSLGLPLSKEDFLGVKTLHIKHNTLLGLAIGNAIAVDSIEIDQPVVQVKQDAQGQFNLIEVAQLLGRALGSNTAKKSTDTGVPKLPQVKLVDATVHFTDNQGRTADLNNIQLNGYAANALVWKYDLKVADSIALTGELAPGGVWKHKVDLVAQNLQPLLQSYGIPTYGAVVKAEWTGELDGDAVNGQLTLQQATATGVPGAKDVSASGAIDLSTAGGIVTVRPQRLDLITGNAMLSAIEVSSGNITYDSSGAHLNGMQLGALGGLAVVDGQFNPATMAGNVHARWDGLALPGGVTHSGHFDASLKTPFTGRPVINVDVESHGKSGGNTWDAKLNVAGIGDSWKNIDWVLTAPQMQYVGTPAVKLDNLTAHVKQQLPNVTLVDVTLPGRPNLLGFGKFDGNIGLWNVYLDSGTSPTADPGSVPLNFSIDAWGNKDRIALKAFNAQVAQATAWAGGYYGLNEPKPVHLDVFINQSAPASTNASVAVVQGHAHGSFHVTGTVFDGNGFTPAVDVSGKLDSSDLVVLQKPVGDIELSVAGGYTGNRVHLKTTELSLFQGRWNFQTEYRTDQQLLSSELDVDDLPLDELAKFVNVQGVSGQLTHAQWTARVPLKNFTLDKVKVESHYALHDISYISAPQVVINSVTADGNVVNGVASLKPIDITSGTGKIDGQITMDLATHRHVLTEFHVHDFPVASNGITVNTNADTKLDLNLPDRELTGPVTATTDVNDGPITLVHAVLDSSLRGRTLTVKNLGGNVLTGTFQGNTVVDLDEPLEATGQFRWFNVDSAALVAIAPGAKGIGGKYSGTITLAPTKEPRPIAPVRIDINVAAADGHYKTVKIGDKGLFAVHAVAYADLDRAILDHSDIHVAGGLVHIWGRVQRGQSAVITLEKLDLDQLAHVVDNLKGPYPGQIDGSIGVVSHGADLNNIIGNVRLKITRSDLANFGPLAKLYAIANASGSDAPIGYGTVVMGLEQKTLKVTEFHYFNRGIDAQGTFKVGPLAKVISSTPVIGSVEGSAQVLKGSRVQLFADINDVFASAQGALAGVGVDGNVGAPHIFAASAAALGNSFQEIFTGDTTYETGKPPSAVTNP